MERNEAGNAISAVLSRQLVRNPGWETPGESMNLNYILLLLSVFASNICAGNFYDFIAELNMAPNEERQAMVDSFINDLPGGEAPIKEDTLAYFIYSGPGTSMSIAGDMTFWSPDLTMIQVYSTDFWYRGFACPADSRLDYKFVRNDSEWILDPLNPHTIVGGFGPNSELAMLDYIQPPEVENHGYPPCEITTYADFHSPQLDNTRTIKVVTPPDYDPEEAYPVLIVHDGLEYISLANLQYVLAYMSVNYTEVALPICICIPPVNRTEEYATTQQQAFGQFIVETVIPFVNENFTTIPDAPEMWGSMGASYGGNISLYLGGAYPETFRNILIMSPHIPQAQYDLIAALPPETFEIYLNWGAYDIPDLLPLINTFVHMLEDRDISHYARQFNEGHSWGLWRATIDEGFQFLFGQGVGVMEDGKNDLGPLEMNLELRAFPNPFGGRLAVLIGGARGPLQVTVHDVMGRVHHRESLDNNSLAWFWYPTEITSGRYVVSVKDRFGRETIPVVHLR